MHIRRLDASAGLHRRLLASVEIDAAPEKVWDVLTDYDKLHTVVPALASSEVSWCTLL